MDTRPTIVVADDHPYIAELCKQLLNYEFNVIAMVSDGRELLQVSADLKPQVVITDISMPGINGLDAGEQLARNSHAAKLIFLTMSMDREVVEEAFRRGASAYVIKHCAVDDLVDAVRTVLNGGHYVSPILALGK